MPKHRHRFVFRGYNSNELTFSCKCGEQRERPPTEDELAWITAENRAWLKEDKSSIHWIGWQFHKWFCKDPKNPMQLSYKGYELMQRLEKFQRYYPTCEIVGCDDNIHMSSLIMLIPHENEDEYWGTTVVVAPQDTAFQEPTIVFLYPSHLKTMLTVLQSLHQRFKQKEPLKKKAEKRERDKQMAAGFKWTKEDGQSAKNNS